MIKINVPPSSNPISFFTALFVSLFAISFLLLSPVNAAQPQILKARSSDKQHEVNSDESNTRVNFVILQYHHVSTETPRVTSVSEQELESHMAYLAKNHNVISLSSALKGIKNNTPLPERSVVITFDDGYKNILTNGHPIFRKYGFEYTIFINPSQIGLFDSQLSWDEVKKMSKEGVTFANHTLDHLHLLDRLENENKESWLVRIQNNIKMAESELETKLGYSKKWLAYPFGEFDTDVKNMLDAMGYIAFGQHSGGVGTLSDLQALPRYPAAGNYANLETLKTKINSLAMPVTNFSPMQHVVEIGETLGEVTISVQMDDITFSRIACYFQGASLPINQTKKGFSINLKDTFNPGRARINCTAPSIKESDRFYWYSIPFFTPNKNGTYND